MDLISKYSSMYFAEKPDEMQPPVRKRLEDYMLVRFRQIFALAGGAKYPCEDLENLLKEERKREPDRLAKIVEGIIKELKAYVDAEEREKERRKKGGKPLIEEYVT
jgi:hypothetical protein